MVFKVVSIKDKKVYTVIDKQWDLGQLYFYVFDEAINGWVWKNANCFKPM